MTFEIEAQGAGTIINVDELQNHGINAGDITKLKAAGVCSIAVWNRHKKLEPEKLLTLIVSLVNNP